MPPPPRTSDPPTAPRAGWVFAFFVVRVLGVGSLAGLALVVVPVLFASMPSRGIAAYAILAILERTAYMGCGAGAFLLLTTLIMHLLSLRSVRVSLTQTALLILMSGLAVGSQILIAPHLQEMLRAVPQTGDPSLIDSPDPAFFVRIFRAAVGILLLQIAAGITVLFFAVRRWYRYLPVRREQPERIDSILGPMR